MRVYIYLFVLFLGTFSINVKAQIGKRLPSEKKVIQDPVTGAELHFLTSTPVGDSKIYPTHSQWTSDGNWLVFRSQRTPGEALAVNEQSGDMVQVTEGGYVGMLTLSRKEMRLYFMQKSAEGGDLLVKSVDLKRVFEDSGKGEMKPKESYQKTHGQIPSSMANGADMALDAQENFIYFKTSTSYASEQAPAELVSEDNFGPRNMGAGPGAIAKMNLANGEIQHVVSVPFQVGHVQVNPWVTGEIVFCWETGGKAPQRMWTVMDDGTQLKPLFPESEFDWVTHEAVITKDEVAFAIMGHRPIVTGEGQTEGDRENPGQEASWGPSGTRARPTGLAIINLRTEEMRIEGQTESGSGLWHVHGSPDGKWAVGDDFARNLYLINRETKEMKLISSGHKSSAQDHPHPTFHPDGDRFQIQSAMLSEDGKSMNICVVRIPEDW
ncbi:TolB-like translocation protein [Pleomorphovibrio marinus]|uniref:PD40 domain-containing protein n=1 Tax=Pleomorphovibrio marinus TaxID=2164132 RepID=UPI000E0A2B32|nr:PD40 domain-containing protein [Pleomorphovibrio marinus]